MCVSQYQYDWEIQIVYACIAAQPAVLWVLVVAKFLRAPEVCLGAACVCVHKVIIWISSWRDTFRVITWIVKIWNQLLMEVMNRWSNNYKLLVDITQLLKSPGGNCAMTWLWNRLRAPHGWNSHDGRFVATIGNIMKWSGSQKESFADMCSKHLISPFLC